MGNNLLCGTGPGPLGGDLPTRANNVLDPEGLLVRAQARSFPAVAGAQRKGGDSSPTVAELGEAGGQCFFLLERCCHVPRRVAAAGALNCGASGAVAGKSHPFVKARVEGHNGAAGGREAEWAEWPVRHHADNPTWFSARPLGVSISEQPEASLHVELWDEGTLLCSLSTRLGDLPGQSVVTLPLETVADRPAEKPSTVSFQILDSSAVFQQRTVFLVRHGESLWNEAQSKGDLREMARTTDHGLSSKGRSQAEGLRHRLESAVRGGDRIAAELDKPDVRYASPLTRAVQTAVIALGPSALQGEFLLMANAREKQNLGGLDSMSTKLGAEILGHTYEELRALCGGCGEDPAAIVETFRRLRFDALEAQEPWWCDGSSDTPAELALRLQDFMSQLLYTPHKTSVVVGHSHFFRSVFKNFISEDFSNEKPQLAKDLTTKKMMNCGVVRLVLDPRLGVAGRPIVRAELVLGTTLDTDGSMLTACCAAPGHTGDSADATFEVETADCGAVERTTSNSRLWQPTRLGPEDKVR